MGQLYIVFLAPVLGGLFVGLLRFVRGQGNRQPAKSVVDVVARIDSSKIPVPGGAGAGIVIAALFSATLIELPELRWLVAPGFVSGLAFGLLLWRKHHAWCFR
jgi:hypothetical protein